MKNPFTKFIPILAMLLSLSFSCTKRPFIPDYSAVEGYVIGKETCKVNETEDYWLVDLTYFPNTPQYGDTLILTGTPYTNVVKIKTLDQRLKQLGMIVSFDFKTITPNKVITSGCGVANPVTYDLKELIIINQFEVR